MQFQSPILFKCICEIRFKPEFVYLSKRLSICDEFKDKFPNWNIDFSKVELHDLKGTNDEDRRNIFIFTNRGASLETNNVGVYENFKALATFIFPKIVDGLELTKLDRIGIRAFSIFKSDLSLTNLNNLLFKKLYSNEIKNRKIFGEITDIAYVINTRKNNFDLHIEIGPVTKAEIEHRFTFKIKDTPEVGILIDLDCFKTNEECKQIVKILREYNEIMNEIYINLLSYLKEGE
jgi:uncharacterized protein (TIGR04255 family)